MHGNDIHEDLYSNCSIHGPLIWGGAYMKSAFILSRYSLLQDIFEKETKCMVMMPIKLSTKNCEIRGSSIRVQMGPIWSYIETSKQFCNSKHAEKDHRR